RRGAPAAGGRVAVEHVVYRMGRERGRLSCGVRPLRVPVEARGARLDPYRCNAVRLADRRDVGRRYSGPDHRRRERDADRRGRRRRPRRCHCPLVFRCGVARCYRARQPAARPRLSPADHDRALPRALPRVGARSRTVERGSRGVIIVTGGAGFIGSNIVRALCARAESVVVVDDLTDGRKFRNLVGSDIADYWDREDALERLRRGNVKPRAVLHQGACAVTTEWDGRYMMDVNYRYSVDLLEYCMAES